MRTKSPLILGVAALVGASLIPASATAASSSLTTTILAKATFSSVRLSGHAHLDTATSNSKGWHKRSDVWSVFLRTHGLTDGYVVDNTFGPGDTSGWHSHPGPSIVFVVHGTITNYDSDVPNCAGQVYAAGSSFTDPGGRDEHMLKNEGTQLAETIAVQFLPAGAARKTPEPTPAGCPAG